MKHQTIVVFLVLMICLVAFTALTKATNKDSLQKSGIENSKALTRDTIILLKNSRLVIISAEKSDQPNHWQNQMPWIAALTVGILAFGANVLISYNSRRTNLETSNDQLDNATRLAISQIDQTRQNSERDFNKTVLSGNRQLWINEFRGTMTEILSSLSSFIIKGVVKDEEYTALKLLIIKTELMLTDDTDSTLVQILSDTQQCCFKITQNNSEVDELPQLIENIKTATLIKLKETWEKVKKGI
jgi:hypothetical protein